MKLYRLLIPLSVAIIALFSPTMNLHAQESGSDTTKVAIADTLGSTLLNEFDKEFDVVFKAVRKGLESAGYVVNYASKKRHLIETEFKILAKEEDDNFFDVMNQYGEVPYIRSPGWTVGRVKITVSFEEVTETKTAIKVQAVVSGYEARFTNQWHYWRSNGKLEQEAMDAIMASVDEMSASGH